MLVMHRVFLVDMSSLVFEVLSGVSQTPVGRAQLDHIATLSSSSPISGYVTSFLKVIHHHLRHDHLFIQDTNT